MKSWLMALALCGVAPLALPQEEQEEPEKQEKRSALEQATKSEWEKAKDKKRVRKPRARDQLVKDCKSTITALASKLLVLRMVHTQFDAKIQQDAPFDEIRDGIAKDIGRVEETWKTVTKDYERCDARMREKAWEKPLDTINSLVDGMQTQSDICEGACEGQGKIPSDQLESALEDVEDLLEQLDDVCDEYDGRIGDDDDDYDDWDDDDQGKDQDQDQDKDKDKEDKDQ